MLPLPLSLIVVFPLLGFIINGLIGRRLPKPIPGLIASGAVLLAFLAAVADVLSLAARPLAERAVDDTVYSWMEVGKFRADISFLLDPLSAVMILVVTGIGFLIHVYSIGYMAHDLEDPEGKLYARFFVYLNLFLAFMSVLVLADNYLLMFVGWEGVGLCSYFLIGFWFQREDAAEASKKAFIVNRIGDFGFLLGMMLIGLVVGSLSYDQVFAAAAKQPELFSTGVVGGLGGIVTITLLLMLGAAGKSAQIPLFVWLPDAMAGPTPVSALIHAATMVTAGVYMTARSAPLFSMQGAETTRLIVCGIGTATALCAGLTALAHTDIKKVLAYSTVSQLGFMFMGVGAGAYVAAIFHVFTHAFFKACLFLGSGSVIHSLHGEQDMRRMGGLAKKMKATNITFLLSGLALAGFFPFAGFFSKDEIIGKVFEAGQEHPAYTVFAIIGLVTALITAIYTGRQYAQVFLGEPRDHHLFDHAHESPAVMTVPLFILAAGAVLAGFLGIPHLPGLSEIPILHTFSNWLNPLFEGQIGAAAHTTTEATKELPPNMVLLGLGVLIGWGGWFAGRSLGQGTERAFLPEKFNVISLNQLYNHTVVRGGFALAAAMRWVDQHVVDGIVNGVGAIVVAVAGTLRLTQTSFVRNYALNMTMGAAVVVGMFLYMMLMR